MRGTPGTPRTVSSADEARQLGHFINDPQRRHPIVVVSADRSGHSSFDADEAAAALRIHADVWVISEIHTWRLNDHLGSETVFGDAAAIFPPHGEGRLTRQLLTPANGHSTDALVQAALAAVPSRAKRARRVERATPAARVLGSPGLHTPTTASEIDLLAEHLLDPGRDRPVVVVTIPSRRSEPWIDAQAIVDTVGPEAEVHLIATGPRTFQLTSRLNRMAGVYGGAGRVYDAGQEWLDDPWRFPLRFAYDEAEGGRATDALVNDLMAALLRSGHVSTAPQETSRPVSGKVAGIVAPSRALISLDDGSMATVWSELTVPGVDVERLLVEGMRVSGMLDPEHRRVDITGMPRDPQQVVTALTPGCAVLARVDEVRSDAVTLTPFPGVSSRLLADEVTGNDLDDLTELMGVGEVVTAHYLGAESAGTWRLRLADVDDDEVAVPLPLIEGGPAWLATTVVDDLTPDAIRMPARHEDDEPERLRAQLAQAERRLGELGHVTTATERLTRKIAELETDLRSRDLEVDTLQREIRDQQREVAALNRRVEHERAGKRRAVQKSNKTKSAPAPVVHGFADPEEDLRWAIRRTWVEQTLPSDKAAWPLPEDYRVGPDFCASLDRLEGVSRDRVLRVVVMVLTGREVPDDHPLRSSRAGGAPAVTRRESGVEWVCRRAPLQQSSPSARRLSYWRSPSGLIELSRVTVHDDLTP